MTALSYEDLLLRWVFRRCVNTKNGMDERGRHLNEYIYESALGEICFSFLKLLLHYASIGRRQVTFCAPPIWGLILKCPTALHSASSGIHTNR